MTERTKRHRTGRWSKPLDNLALCARVEEKSASPMLRLPILTMTRSDDSILSTQAVWRCCLWHIRKALWTSAFFHSICSTLKLDVMVETSQALDKVGSRRDQSILTPLGYGNSAKADNVKPFIHAKIAGQVQGNHSTLGLQGNDQKCRVRPHQCNPPDPR